MASYAPLTLFSPSMAKYENASQYGEMAKTEAVKQASYLSQMDQFYQQLEESTRQFDLTLAAQKEMFGAELGFKEKGLTWEKERFGQELGFQEKTLTQRESEFERTHGVSLKQLELAQKQLEMSGEQFEKTFGIQKSESDYMLGLYDKLYSDKRINAEQQLLQNQLTLSDFYTKQLTTPRYIVRERGGLPQADTDWQKLVDSWLTGGSGGSGYGGGGLPTLSSGKTATPEAPTTSGWSGGTFSSTSPWGGYAGQVADLRTRAGSGGFI